MTAVQNPAPRPDWRRAAIAILVVALAYASFWLAVRAPVVVAPPGLVKLVLWTALPLLAAAAMARSVRAAASAVGLRPPFVRALAPGLAAGAAMAGVLVFAFGRAPALPDSATLLYGGVAGPFAEEILFRGFLIHQLLSARFGPRTAAFASAALFGAVHLPQVWGEGPAMIAMEFAVTAFGGLVFAAVMLLAGGSVIAPFALHAALNLVWAAFALSDTAIGGADATLARALAILAAVAMALALRRRAP